MFSSLKSFEMFSVSKNGCYFDFENWGRPVRRPTPWVGYFMKSVMGIPPATRRDIMGGYSDVLLDAGEGQSLARRSRLAG